MQKLGAILTVLAASGIAAAQTPGFWLTGLRPGTTYAGVGALTPDGRVAAGSIMGVGFTWTRESGRYDFGLEPGMPGVSYVYGISSDGGIIAGSMYPNLGTPLLTRAYRRVGNGPLVDLGLVTGNTRAYARGMSGDGNTVVGGCEWGQATSLNGQAFRWTPQGGMQGLGYARPGGQFSRALGVSLDGSTIVGESFTNLVSDAFIWRESTGIQALPRLPGAASNSWSRASAVNSDGTVIVGDGDSPVTGTSTAVRWAAGGVQDLGLLPGYLRSISDSVDGSGNIIGGRLVDGVQPDTAFVWTPLGGMQIASDYLAGHGITVTPGYRVLNVSVISADGLTYGGWVIDTSTNALQGFVATVPSPAAAPVLLLTTALIRRRRSAAD